MKKILIIFDEAQLPLSSLVFALSLNNEMPILLTGVFLPSVAFANFSDFTYYGKAIPPYYIDEYNESSSLIKKNMEYFKNFCEKHRVEYLIHEDIKGDIIDTLRNESRFADLMILSGGNFRKDLETIDDNDHINNTLHKLECPLVFLPELYTQPDSLVLAYDGTESSMYAMKQFIYLLPHLTNIETHVVYIGDNKHEIPFLNLIKEYAPQHFNKVVFSNVQIELKSYLHTRVDKKETVMLIAGALGRNKLSSLFHKTFVKDLIQNAAIPVFIAHK